MGTYTAERWHRAHDLYVLELVDTSLNDFHKQSLHENTLEWRGQAIRFNWPKAGASFSDQLKKYWAVTLLESTLGLSSSL